MRRKLIVSNLKMNGSLISNAAFFHKLKSSVTMINNVDIVVCVPTPYLAQAQMILNDSTILLGAQDLSMYLNGAYTGEVSALMLKEFDCKYVIIGHSERRIYHNEIDITVANKTIIAIQSGLIPIICVGETLVERKTGQTNQVISRQLDLILTKLDSIIISEIVLAYEPIWAINTGHAATPAMTEEVHLMLYTKLKNKFYRSMPTPMTRILYGGSIQPNNARELLGMPNIDGGLIGSAALKIEDFLEIIYIAQE